MRYDIFTRTLAKHAVYKHLNNFIRSAYKALLAGILLFIIHAMLLYSLLIFAPEGKHISKWSILIFHTIYGIWVYPVLVLGYMLLLRSSDSFNLKFIKALIIICIGYLATWIPNFIWGGIIQQFKWQDIIIYPFLAFTLIKIEQLIMHTKHS